MNEKLGVNAREQKFQLGLNHFIPKNIYFSGRSYTTGRIFLYVMYCSSLDRHFISNSKFIINSLTGLLKHPIFYISRPWHVAGLLLPVHTITAHLTGFSNM